MMLQLNVLENCKELIEKNISQSLNLELIPWHHINSTTGGMVAFGNITQVGPCIILSLFTER